MNFNKIFLSAIALAAVTMTSCSSEEDMPSVPTTVDTTSKAITFNTYTGAGSQSRATIMNDNLLKEQGFGIFAYNTGSNYFTTDMTGLSMNFMANQKVTWDAASDFWTYSPVKYWPKGTDTKITFLAYAPYFEDAFSHTEKDGLLFTSGASGGYPMFQYIIPEDVTKQVDFVYSNENVNVTESASDSPITFRFKHALAWINLEAVHNIDNAQVVINNIVVSNDTDEPLCTAGAINLAHGAWYTNEDSYDKTKKWRFTAKDFGNRYIQHQVTGLLNENAKLLTIPDFEGHQFKVTVDYTVTIDDNNVSGGKVVTNNSSSVICHILPEAGKVHSYTLHLTADEIEVTGSVTNWD